MGRRDWAAATAVTALAIVLAVAVVVVRGLPRPAPIDLEHESEPVEPRQGVRAAADRGEPPADVTADEAPAARPQASRWNRDGIAALEDGRVEHAVECFERCVELDPDEPVFRSNLAQALIRLALERRELGPCDDCTALLARAAELAPERDDVARLLARWREEDAAEEGFWRDSSLHFDLSYDGSRRDLLHGYDRILEVLEDAYIDFGEFFGHHPVEAGRARIQVVLYRRDQFGALTGLGDWAGGAFDGTVRVPVEDLAREGARLRNVLRHELVHAFVAVVGGPNVPGWLNEGLAQWLEDARAARIAAARARLAGRSLFALDELRGTLAAWDDAEAIATAYAQSVALCDHLAVNYGERVLVEMVEACKTGDPEVVFRARTRLSLDQVLADLAAELAE